MNIFQIQGNPHYFDTLAAVSKVAVFWSNAKKTNFLPENNSQKQSVLFCFVLCVEASVWNRCIAGKYCTKLLFHFWTDSDYNLLAKTTSMLTLEKVKGQSACKCFFYCGKTHHRNSHQEWNAQKFTQGINCPGILLLLWQSQCLPKWFACWFPTQKLYKLFILKRLMLDCRNN